MSDRRFKRAWMTAAMAGCFGFGTMIAVVRAQIGGSDPSPESEWSADTGIVVTITSPSDDSTKMYINETLDCSATASDTDKYSNDGGHTWYTYSDDVSSGTSSADYHIWWTTNIGSFTELYGPSTTYIAPDYSDGAGIRTADIAAHADDFNRGTDVLGADDAPAQAVRQAQVNQIIVTSSQAGNHVGTYNPAILPAYGSGQKGWLAYNAPLNCKIFGGGTELTGNQGGAGPGWNFAGMSWSQEIWGVQKHKAAGVWTNDFTAPANNPATDGVPYTDMAGPLYSFDAPGFPAGANGANDNFQVANGWTDASEDVSLNDWIMKGNVRVSNKCQWSVSFALNLNNNNQWQANGPHTP